MSAAAIRKTLTNVEAKIVKLNEELTKANERKAALDIELAAAEASERITNAGANGELVGQAVTYTYGRAEKKVQLEGTAVAFKPAEAKVPAQYRIQHGDGFNVEFHTVYASLVAPLNGGAAADPVAGV